MKTPGFTKSLKGAMADLYSGHKGTYLTAYLNNPHQLPSVIHNAQRLMRNRHAPEAIDEFLKPLRRLVSDQELLHSPSPGSWALFRSESQFRIKRVPSQIPPISVVSNSFHIKPLLKWWQTGGRYNALFLNWEQAFLFEKQPTGLRKVDEVSILGGPIQNWIDDWVEDSLSHPTYPLVLCGEDRMIRRFLSQTELGNVYPEVLLMEESPHLKKQIQKDADDIFSKLVLTNELQHRQDLMDASKLGLASFNLEKVARDLARNKIHRLYLAEDKHAWGTLDRNSGQVNIHPAQRDCQDEDVLDDLAELALSKGVEIVLLPQSEIPTAALAAAIYRPRDRRKESHPVLAAG